ncbi:MAG: hypothetical protein BA863_14610 [Desulfovibrio sp. S3730MH75]|nr:MAG: hypothetical protein BA863_14610 [Desulfovibrio sp. S3730MH75]
MQLQRHGLYSMNLAIFTFALLTSIILNAGTCYAGNKLSFATYKIPLLVENSQEGIFIELVKEACSRLKITPEIKIYPPKRALKVFQNNQCQAIFPSLDIPSRKESYKTIPIHYKRAFAFTISGTPPPTSIAELEGKIIGVTRGYSYPRSIINNPEITIDWADSFPSSLQKLLKGRIDCFIGDPDITIESIHRMDIKLNYDLTKPLFEEPAFIAFQHNQRGAFFAKQFSKILKGMQQDGTMDRIKRSLLKVGCDAYPPQKGRF